ncbi:hypothetical protein RIF23_18550 [Lipingzhangella sp. LS1_29]|uniref:Uncharacterized protein n=1 Tax=Lipingzhangella rawalii TaxID=2055835 RepID=A0ABU2HAE6_9ACTN|nr:hypothetical protein [Lipingzhangella rawalii]MDS1272294.1 hypothetical protein [Lipingzhangella rawalii]
MTASVAVRAGASSYSPRHAGAWAPGGLPDWAYRRSLSVADRAVVSSRDQAVLLRAGLAPSVPRGGRGRRRRGRDPADAYLRAMQRHFTQACGALTLWIPITGLLGLLDLAEMILR